MKVKMGSIVTDAVGKSGGHVIKISGSERILGNMNYTPKTKGAYARPMQGVVSRLKKEWRELLQLDREQWLKATNLVTLPNRVGDTHTLSGFALWLKWSVPRAYVGFPYRVPFGQPDGGVNFPELRALHDPRRGFLLIQNKDFGMLDITRILIYFQVRRTSGQRITNRKPKLIGWINTPDVNQVEDVSQLALNAFGFVPLPDDTNIFVRAHSATNGYLGEFQLDYI